MISLCEVEEEDWVRMMRRQCGAGVWEGGEAVGVVPEVWRSSLIAREKVLVGIGLAILLLSSNIYVLILEYVRVKLT